MHARHVVDDEPMAEMNLIPLIDIALTLLIILMVTTAFIRHPGISLKLPETVTREGAPETSKDHVILVARDGLIYLDGAVTTLPALGARLSAVGKTKPDTRVLVKGDQDVPYNRMMQVMDRVRQAGLTRIVLPTDPQPESGETNNAAP